MLEILKIIYQFENHAATTLEIRAVRNKLGFSDEKSYNSLMVQNGKRIKSYFNKEAILDDDGVETFWNWFFDGFSLKGKDRISTNVKVGRSAKSKGWALSRNAMSKLIPISEYEGYYPITVDGIKCDGKLMVNPRLFYTSEELQEHLTKLAEENPNKKIPLELEFKDENRTGFEFKLKKELEEAIKTKYTDLKIKYPHNSYDLIDTLLEDNKPTVSLDDFESTEIPETTYYADSFYEYLLDNGYYFDKETIENYLLSLKVKSFAILTGNSGTGKTKLSQLFAKYWTENYYKSYNVLKNDYNSNLDKSNFEDICEEYISFEMSRGTSLDKSLNKGEFGAPTRKWGPIKDIINLDKLSKELVKFKIDDIEVDVSLLINSGIWCRDESLSDYFRESSNKDTFSIKVKKEDIKNLIRPLYDMPMKTMELNRNIGTKAIWAFPKEFINNFIPLKIKSDLNIIIDGKPTVAEFIIFKIEFMLKEGSKGFAYFKEKSSKNPNDNIIINVSSSRDCLENVFDDEYLDSNGSVEYLSNIGSESFNFISNYKIVPVGANWTENRNIVGYYNLITEEYQSTPAYELINQSKDNLDSPHFLILDEMNLSHVERYFADFLSAIESGENIPLYGIEDDLEIPNNLFIIGTVNVDETTYMFSPKVLDRANVLEFETYSSKDYMLGNINLDAPNGNISYLENPLVDSDIRNLGINELKEAFNGVKVNNVEFWDLLSDEIFKFQNILKKSGFDFGFRVINEIVRFMLVAWRYEGEPTEWTNWERYFDAQIKQKLLPKLHGSEKILGDTLKDLAEACVDDERVKYYSSAKKLKEMMDVLDKQRYVSFIN